MLREVEIKSEEMEEVFQVIEEQFSAEDMVFGACPPSARCPELG